jgi:alkylated DNA repair protein (DNA oxidative demethylase)
MTTESLFPRAGGQVVPGAIHVPDWLTIDEQRELVTACRRWARPPAPMHAPRLPTGATMSVQMVCLGWHWAPYRYTRTADDVDGAPVTPFPARLGELGRRAIRDAYGDPVAADTYDPDVALVNLYTDGARMGMHQDRDERSDDPVVSLSLGDSCTFRFGNTATRGRPYHDVELASGDLFVFGGPSRYAFHGVPKVHSGTGPREIGLEGARLNLTMRVTGLLDP